MQDIEVNAFAVFLVGAAALGALAVVWLMPRNRPRYLWTFCIFVIAALAFWLIFAEVVGAAAALILATLVPIAKIMNMRERLGRQP